MRPNSGEAYNYSLIYFIELFQRPNDNYLVLNSYNCQYDFEMHTDEFMETEPVTPFTSHIP